MESDAKQRSHQRNRRRERAARMQKQKAEGRTDQGSGEEGDESPARHQKQRPPTRKKRIKVGKEPIFEEDVIDGFAILSFRTYEDLENTMKSLEKRSSPVEFVLDAKITATPPFNNHNKQRHKQVPNLLTNNNNNNNNNTNNNNEEEEEEERAEEGGVGGGGATSDSENCKPITQEVNGPLHNNNNNNNGNSARYRLSDVSSHSSSGRGYMCDSESNDDRGSDTDLFRAASIKRESNSTPTNGRTSSPLLLLLPSVQNGPTEPSPPVPTTTTTSSCTTNVVTSKSPSPAPLFSPPFLVEGGPPPKASQSPTPATPSLNHLHHHRHHHHHHHPLLHQQTPQQQLPPPPVNHQPPQQQQQQQHPLHFFSPISPRPQLQASSSSSPPLLLSASPSVPPKSSSSSVCSTTSVITQARPSPGVGASPATTPSRDSHSSSSSSISSLSQLSQSLHPHRDASRSSSRNNTPSCCGVPTSLVFSKPSWASPGTVNGPHLTPPPARPTPPPPAASSGPLGLPLHNHFGPPGPSLHPSGPHPGIFPPPPPIALSSPSLSLASAGPAAPFTDPIFSQPNQQDLLRRELDTRFLASQDRTISIPPPPYMRAEMHAHMHQHSPFLQLANSMVSQPNPHMYDKFAKLEPSSFYARNTLGLASYPGLTPLAAPGPPPTPFAPAGQLAAFQPKKHPNLVPRSRLDPVLPENMSNLVKSKTLKSGRWCAMHVRIAWEIYHHQQKQQQQAEAHKAAGAPVGKSPADLLRPPGHLFSAIPRPHELPPLSTSLLAASAASGRFEAQAQHHHNSFLNPSPAHLGVSHFARPPTYPGFAGPGASFAAGLSTLGLAGPGLFANRDLGAAASCLSGLSGAQDSLYRLHRAPPTFPPPI